MNRPDQPLVNIITPVFNGEEFLVECVESVLAQTYQNWEYILVNNCSTDRTLEIARHYARKDKRIRIHNNERFLNVMQNNNNAFRQISPDCKYCKPLHADDWLFPDCLRNMVEVAEENPTVGIVGAYRLDENWVNLDGLPYPSNFVPGRQVCRLHLLGDDRFHLFGSPTSLLYRSDLVRKRPTFFNESHIHGDKEACLELLQYSDFGFVHQVLTFTRRHNESESSFAKIFRTHLAADFIILMKYGPLFLTEKEYEKVSKSHSEAYYRILAISLFRSRKRELLSYQKDQLAEIGYRLSILRLFRAAVIVLYNRLLRKLQF